MSMKEMPEGFPLDSIDSKGQQVKEGDKIRIDSMPDSVLSDYLSEEEKSDVLSCEGKDMEIKEIDDFGYVWVEKILLHTEDQYNIHSFCIEPKYVTKL